MAVSGSGGGGGSGGIRAGRAFVELFTKDNAVYRGLATLQKRLSSLGSFSRAVGAGMLGAGASVLGGVLALFDRVSKNGKGLTGKEQRQLAFAGDAVREAWEGVETIFGRIVAALIPTREEIAAVYSVVSANLATVRRFIDNNRALVRGVVIGAAALSVGGLALIAFGTAASAAATAIGVAVAVVKGLAVAVGVLTSPLGLAAVALGALGYLFVTQTEKGKKWAADTGDYFREVKGTAVEAWEGISAAIAKGDLEGAAKVALAALNVEWIRATNELKAAWAGFLDYWESAWDDIAYTVKDATSRFEEDVATSTIDTIANMKKQYTEYFDWFAMRAAGVSEFLGDDEFAANLRKLADYKPEDLTDDAIAGAKKKTRDEFTAEQKALRDERDQKEQARAAERERALAEANRRLEEAKGEMRQAVEAAKKGAAKAPDFTPGVRAAATTLGTFNGPFAQVFGQGNSIQEKIFQEGKKGNDLNAEGNGLLRQINEKMDRRAVFQ